MKGCGGNIASALFVLVAVVLFIIVALANITVNALYWLVIVAKYIAFLVGPFVLGIWGSRFLGWLMGIFGYTSHKTWNRGVKVILVIVFIVMAYNIGLFWTRIYPNFDILYREDLISIVGIIAGVVFLISGVIRALNKMTSFTRY